MAVHAHPDDEATGTGGVLARYAGEGIRTVLVTCTDGRCGDGPGGVKPGDPGHEPDVVAATRRRELEESCRVLQVSHLELLGYADSGMMGWSTNEAPGSFWSTPVPEAAARLSELMRHYEPHVVVTYDENGFYGHPDHIQTHRVTMAALAQSGVRAKVYWTTAPRSAIEEVFSVFRELEPDLADAASGNPEDDLPDDVGLPDNEISTWVDTAAFSRQKYDALAAHASQEENILFLRIGPARFSKLMSMETFIRVQDPTGSPLPEDDLFAGLR